MKQILLVIWAQVVPLYSISGQNGSFQVAIDPPSNKYRLDQIAVNDQDHVVCLSHIASTDAVKEYMLMPVNKSNTFKAKRLTISSGNNYLEHPKMFFFKDRTVFGFQRDNYDLIFNFDFATGKTWCKFISYGNGKPKRTVKSFAKRPNGELLVYAGFGFDGPPKPTNWMNLLSLDDSGSVLWQRCLEYKVPGIDPLVTIAGEMDIDPITGIAYVTGEVTNEKGDDGSVLIKFAPDGLPLLWKATVADVYEKVFSHQGAVFLLGRTKQPLPFSQNKENCVLAKLDADLSPIWVRAFSGEAFEYKRSTLNFLPDGSMVLGYSTFGAFPTVLARLDSSGKVISQQGYPLYEPRLEVLSDGSLMLLTRSHFDSTGKVFPKPIIAKTGSDGLIEGCETFPSCLTDGPASISFTPFDLHEITDTLLLQNRPVSVDSLDLNLTDFCDVPAPPAPDFVLPDSICIGTTLKPSSLKNALADHLEWHITGPATDQKFVDKPSISFKPKTPGQFKVAQKVFFLGCGYEHERVVTVLPPLAAKIQPEGLVCEGPPAQLSVQSNRPLKTFEWSTVATSAEISAAASGLFWVKTSDGFCEAIDSASISFLSEKLDGQPPLALPADTSVCLQNLPFVLKPASLFTQTFSLESGGGSAAMDSTFLLKGPGLFEITADIDGCLFSKKFTLSVIGCEPKIYFPTAFSPDGDGLNDSFFPQGEGFRAVRLTVFDRWGNIWFEDDGPAPAWSDLRAQPGVFTYLFEFENLLDGSKGRQTGTVTVVK